MVILIWIQAGFAMVVLGAALKAIPDEILEAARMDGATGFTLFRTVQIPMIRNTLIVVVTTITIATLKIFDIVFTLNDGNFNTDVLADQMYNDLFVTNQIGRGLGARRDPVPLRRAAGRLQRRATAQGACDAMTTSNPPIVHGAGPSLAERRPARRTHGCRPAKAVRKAFSHPIASRRRHRDHRAVDDPAVRVLRELVPRRRTTSTRTGWWDVLRPPAASRSTNYHDVLFNERRH